jgi:hypothetical protein
MGNMCARSVGFPGLTLFALLITSPVWGQSLPIPVTPVDIPPLPVAPGVPPLDLDPQLIQSSPVLQRWLQQVPDVAADIERDPSFRSRVRLGYSQFPSTRHQGGFHVGVEDVFIGKTPLTVSADYHGGEDRSAWGADLHYYVRPLGKRINVAPVVGYRHLKTPQYSTDGVNVGARLLVVLSRGGGADMALTQTWVAPGSDAVVGLTRLSFGYALTHNLRLSTDIERQTAYDRQDSRVGIGLEWMP